MTTFKSLHLVQGLNDSGILSRTNTWTAEQTFTGQMIEDRFVSQLHSIVGGADTMRLLWMPKSGDTTGATTRDKDGRTITWDADVASRLTRLGSGYSQDFDGTDDEGDTPDVDDLSFGDGATDEPFSIIVLVSVDAYGGSDSILICKADGTSAEEWTIHLTGTNGYPRVILNDESENTTIGRLDATAFGTGTWGLLVATYDGSGAVGGLRIYKNGARVDDTDASGGTYEALENTSAKVHIGAERTTKRYFLNGQMALAAIVAKQLQLDEVWAINDLVNSFFDLSL
jgi:hypothetical protein